MQKRQKIYVQVGPRNVLHLKIMWSRQNAAIVLLFLVQLLAFATGDLQSLRCKAIPGSSDWPSSSEWAALNASISGRLLNPSPPGAVCHPTQPTFNAAVCPAVQAGWLTTIWHTENPVSTIENNWNNDTCLPIPTVPCSGAGYPVYVVNATCVEDVKQGIDFARANNVRLIVKGTGHDYMGRYRVLSVAIIRVISVLKMMLLLMPPGLWRQIHYQSGHIICKACLSRTVSSLKDAKILSIHMQ